MSTPISRFLLFALGFSALPSKAFGDDVLEDLGPPHDPVTGDYELNNPNFPPETPIPDPTEKECKEFSKIKHDHFVLEIPEYIVLNNYSLETHRVTTEDGYILKVYRISGSPLSPPKPGKIPIYLNHGLAGNAWSWLMLADNGSLAFKAANEGFDVWIGNARGSEYSPEHTHYTPADAGYWEFSFHELGYYDVPAVIDYVLNVTGQKDLYYAGHSLGTMQYLIAMSERPEYNAKIRVGFLLATAAHIKHIRSVSLRYVISAHSAVDYLRVTNGDRLDPKKFKSMAGLLGDANSTCATASARLPNLKATGFNPNQNNIMDTQLFNEKYFSTTSTKVFSHLHQSMLSGNFKKYDYMDSRNFAKYQTNEAPPYKLNLITASTVNFWGFSDEVTVPEDVKLTMSKLAPGVLKENNRVAIKSFNHLDFLIAKDVEKYVYNRMIWIMQTGKYLDKNVTVTQL